MIIVNCAVVAQSPAVGLKVYVVVVVLSTGKSQVPVIPLVEVNGKGANGLPAQTGGIAVKVGVTLALTVIVLVVFVLAQPAVAGISYLMIEVPALIPVTTPVEAFTVATLTFEDVQDPPTTVDENIDEPPTQTD